MRAIRCLALLVFAAVPLRAQLHPTMSLGLSTTSTGRSGVAFAVALHRNITSQIQLGGELQYHMLDEVAPGPVYTHPPCLPPGCTTQPPNPVAGRQLLLPTAGVQFFDTPRHGGFFLQLGVGPALYLKQRQPAETPRASLAATAASGISIPVQQMALRLELRMVSLVHPDYKRTLLGMLGFGVQL